jgi:hypothetical protein
MLYIQTVIQERNRILRVDDEPIEEEEIEFVEPTEEELEQYHREKTERYWRNKT